MRSHLLFVLLLSVALAQACKKGSSGCTTGNCCSYWGYCGKTNDYCGSGTYQCVCDCSAKGPCVGSAAPSCTNYKVTASSLNIRTGPGTNYAVSRTVSSGTILCVVSISGDWAKLSDGKYASKTYLSISGSTATSTSTGTSTSTANGVKLDIKQVSTKKYSSRDGWVPDVIVCHITEGAYAGAVSWLSVGSGEVSCHFVVSKKGEVTQIVPLSYMAWCNGLSSGQISSATSSIIKSRSANPNKYTISIEHEGVWSDCKGCLPDAQKQASGKLIKHIVNEVKRIYGKTIPIDRDHIIGHYQISPSNKPNCPGQNFPWADVISIAKSA